MVKHGGGRVTLWECFAALDPGWPATTKENMNPERKKERRSGYQVQDRDPEHDI